MENPNVTPEKLAISDQVTANQFEAARNIAVAALRRHQECAASSLSVLMPDHFSSEDFVGEAEIEKAIDILNAIDADLFIESETDPDVGSVGWLNAALDSRKTSDTF
jgi:hypothetical protein